MKHKISITALTILSLSACKTTQGPALLPNAQASNAATTYADPDIDCANTGKVIGTIALGILGGYLGKEIGGDSRSANMGRLLGGVAGYMIGANYDNKKCELAKISAKYKVPIQTAPIQVLDARNPNAPLADRAYHAKIAGSEKINADTIVGTTVQIGNPQGEGHFAVGSDQLTPAARFYFKEIALQYVPGANLNTPTSAADKAKIEQTFRASRILLVGHTDDTGSSDLNASLSERRARSVATFLATQGVPVDMLYFQGAGESHPLADNATELGRANNRRVEIVQLGDEASFRKYVQQRTPNYAYYRKANPTPKTSVVKTQVPAGELANDTSYKEVKSASAKDARTSSVAGLNIDFGGQPLAKSSAINVGLKSADKSPFSLISNAFASDPPPVANCSDDRARASGSVRSLKSGERYVTADFLPGLDRNSWVDNVSGHLVALNSVGVLKDGSVANSPELLVYKSYKDSKSKPDLHENPQVNSYKGERGLLYRVFASGKGGVRCIDLVFPPEGGNKVQQGWLVYDNDAGLHQAPVVPRLVPNKKGRV